MKCMSRKKRKKKESAYNVPRRECEDINRAFIFSSNRTRKVFHVGFCCAVHLKHRRRNERSERAQINYGTEMFSCKHLFCNLMGDHSCSSDIQVDHSGNFFKVNIVNERRQVVHTADIVDKNADVNITERFKQIVPEFFFRAFREIDAVDLSLYIEWK